MLGRTHMAIGALGASVLVPLWLHSPWSPVLPMASHLLTQAHVNSPLAQEAGVVLAGLVGGLAPDLDESHSIMARKLESGVRLLVMLATAWLAWVLHAPLWGIGATAIGGLFLVSGANNARKVALSLLSAGALYGAYAGWLSAVGGLTMSVWAFGAMMTGHRTFTHSLAGLALWGVALVHLIPHTLPVLAPAAVLAYALHLAADVPSGGVPLLWPYPRRQGVHAIRTGGGMDHLIGGVATLLLLARLVIG